MRYSTQLIARLALPLLVGAALVALVLELRREPPRASLGGGPPADAAARSPAASSADGNAAAASRASSTASPRLDLEEMSESFRNTTFVIAIRDAGFVCEDVVAAHATGDRVWTASCRGMLGYEINEQLGGALSVEPIAHYFDALTRPVLLDQEPLRERIEQPAFPR